MIYGFEGLKGKKALITGGSKGIGEVIAMTYAQAGANVIITGRNNKNLKETVIKLRETGIDAEKYSVDHYSEKATLEFLEQLKACRIHIDIIVNNVGTGYVKEIENVKMSDWQKYRQLMISTPAMIIGTFVETMKKNRWGKIINISSVLGTVGREQRTIYCALKGAIQSFTKSLAIELSEYNINVNSICPGQFYTPLTRSMWEDKAKREAVNYYIPFDRWGDVKDLRGLALLLGTDAGSYITGQNIHIDGGWSAR